MFRAVGRSLGLALERAEQSRLLRERTEALDAFVRFAEASGLSSDLGVLVQQAFSVLGTFFPGCTSFFHERQENRWEIEYYTHNISVEVAELMLAGLPEHTPLFAAALESLQPAFVDDWHMPVPGSNETFRTTGVYPVLIGGEVQAFLGVWLRNSHQWLERDRAIVRAVGRSLNLALERAVINRELRVQQTELEARSKALQAFSALTRDLTLQADDLTLIKTAQDVALSMLPPGCALYYRPAGDRWRLISQVGELHNPELQRALDMGLPFDSAQNLLIPWTTRRRTTRAATTTTPTTSAS